MKKYLVPLWNYENKKLQDHLALIEADSKYHAMLIALGTYEVQTKYPKWHVDLNYEAYQECNNPENIFTYMDRNGNIKTENTTHIQEDITMATDIYNYMYLGNYNEKIQELADKALPEKWDFEDTNDNYILKNYLKYTFNKLQSEEKVIETETYCVFNTGLFSRHYEPIYAYGEINRSTVENAPKWFFKGFKDKYELASLDIVETFPDRADYFSDPSKLVFNWHLEVIINYSHILEDLNTNQRLPDSIKNSDRPLEILKGVIDTSVQRVIANYKLAIPHYYTDKIQLMIPLCFGKTDEPDVALVLGKLKNNYYQATTCLDMKMAYLDARLIAKPESSWLTI